MIDFLLSRLDNVPEIFNFSREEFAFLYLEIDTRMFRTCQYIVDLLFMVFNRVPVDDYVFPLQEASFPLVLSSTTSRAR